MNFTATFKQSIANIFVETRMPQQHNYQVLGRLQIVPRANRHSVKPQQPLSSQQLDIVWCKTINSIEDLI